MIDIDRPTFKQYLDGREQLIRAIESTPVTVVEYQVQKYCSLALGESKEEETIVGLKPNQRLIVQWRYERPNAPTPDFIKLVGVTTIDESEEQQTHWTPHKLQRWLTRHTKEGK